MMKHDAMRRRKASDVVAPSTESAPEADAVETPPPDQRLALPARHGHSFANVAVEPPLVQPQLEVSQPDDPLEREAEAVAERVTAEEPQGTPRASRGGGRSVAAAGAGDGDGQPLDERTRSYMEPRFGHSFESVRLHTDADAAASASLIQARAYTLGADIVFGAGEYEPDTDAGRRLLAHELTHVIQQASGAVPAQRMIQRQPTPTPPAPPAPTVVPPGMNNASVPPHAASAQSVRVTVSTGADPEYSSQSRNTGSGLVVISANPEETYASLRALGIADMWNMACVVGNLSQWVNTVPDAAPLTSPGGGKGVQLANADAADTAFDEKYRLAFPTFKSSVQTFYKKFKDFQEDFKKRGTEATLGVVKESRARTKKSLEDLGITGDVTTERGPLGSEPTTTYKSDSEKNKSLSGAATRLAEKQEALEKLLKQSEDNAGWIHWAITSNDELEKERKEMSAKIDEARKAWQTEKAKARADFPILSYFETTEQLKQLKNPASTAHYVGEKLHEILDNTQELEDKLKLGNDRILTQPEHLERLKDTFALNPFERHAVNYMREKYTGDIETSQRIAVLIVVVLAAITAAPTAGGSLVALAAATGEAAINTMLLLQAYDQYSFDKAAASSDEDKANALSHDEPSFGWLAFQFVTTAVGVAGNAKVVMTELKTAFNEIKTGYKMAATTGEAAPLEASLKRQKVPKEVSEGIVARAVKDAVTILEGIAKGGPEGIQAALDLLKGSPSFYSIRLAVWRIKAAANAGQARGNLQAARQQIMAKIAEEYKAKYPKATFAVIDQGFERPIIIKIGSSEAPPPSAPAPSSAPPSGAPPSGGPAPSGHPAGPGSDKPDSIPPDVAKTPVQPPPSGLLVQARKPGEAAADVAGTGAGASSPAAPPAPVPADAGQSPLGGPGVQKLVGSPTGRASQAGGGAFHPPMALPEGVNQALDAADALRAAPEAALGGVSAAAGADVSVELEATLVPYGPMPQSMEAYYAARPNLPKPSYSGLYVEVSTRFTVHEDLTRKFAGKGTSVKVILQDSSVTGPNAPLYMFKPGWGEHVEVAKTHLVKPGVFFVAGRASYDIGLNLPTVAQDIVPLGVALYNGQLGSLQPFIRNTENLGDLMVGAPTNPTLSKDQAKQLFREIWEENAQFRTFRENLRAYDHVINNPDRNEGNFLVEFNDDMSVRRFYAIDQDLALKPGARTIMRPDREVIPRFAPGDPATLAALRNPQSQKHLEKISRTLYDEMLMMKVNEFSVREALAKTYGIDKPTLDGIFQRLDEVLQDYNLRLQTMKPEDVFAD